MATIAGFQKRQKEDAMGYYYKNTVCNGVFFQTAAWLAQYSKYIEKPSILYSVNFIYIYQRVALPFTSITSRQGCGIVSIKRRNSFSSTLPHASWTYRRGEVFSWTTDLLKQEPPTGVLAALAGPVQPFQALLVYSSFIPQSTNNNTMSSYPNYSLQHDLQAGVRGHNIHYKLRIDKRPVNTDILNCPSCNRTILSSSPETPNTH